MKQKNFPHNKNTKLKNTNNYMNPKFSYFPYSTKKQEKRGGRNKPKQVP